MIKIANIKSMNKVLDYLKNQDKAVSLTKINLDIGVPYTSVKEIVSTLEKLNKIKIMQTDHTTLVKISEEKEWKN